MSLADQVKSNSATQSLETKQRKTHSHFSGRRKILPFRPINSLVAERCVGKGPAELFAEMLYYKEKIWPHTERYRETSHLPALENWVFYPMEKLQARTRWSLRQVKYRKAPLKELGVLKEKQVGQYEYWYQLDKKKMELICNNFAKKEARSMDIYRKKPATDTNQLHREYENVPPDTSKCVESTPPNAFREYENVPPDTLNCCEHREKTKKTQVKRLFRKNGNPPTDTLQLAREGKKSPKTSLILEPTTKSYKRSEYVPILSLDNKSSKDRTVTSALDGNKGKTLNLIKNDYSTQVNQIVVEWSKQSNGVSHMVGTKLYGTISKLLHNLLQGKPLACRKSGEPTKPLSTFYKECIIPKAIQARKWTVSQIIDTLHVVNDELDTSTPLDTILWNHVQIYSRFLATASATLIQAEGGVYAKLAERLRKECYGWDIHPLGRITLELQQLAEKVMSCTETTLPAFEKTVDWWIKNRDNKFTPTAFTVREFVKKWPRIYSARRRELQDTLKMSNPNMELEYRSAGRYAPVTEEQKLELMRKAEERGYLTAADCTVYGFANYAWIWDKGLKKYYKHNDDDPIQRMGGSMKYDRSNN